MNPTIMMREMVCLVLNEREPHKARAAELLQHRLSECGITASRVEIVDGIEKLLVEKAPQILVLDYLLGDYSTGLDVQAAVNRLPPSKRPTVFFLTDEPSVQVAVQAMRQGALNYYEVDNPHSLGKLVQEIRDYITEQIWNKSRPVTPPKSISLSDVVAQSSLSRDMVKRAETAVAKKSGLIVIEGPVGSGRFHLAQAIVSGHADMPGVKILDLSILFDDIESFFQSLEEGLSTLSEASLICVVKNLERDDGSLLEIVKTRFPELDSSGRSDGLFLIGCSEDSKCSRLWKKSFADCEILTVPSINQRKEDIPPLVQRFALEAAEICGSKIKCFSPEVISNLAERDWPGEIRQLRAVVLDTGIRSTLGDEDTEALINDNYNTWIEHSGLVNGSLEPEPFVVARTLEFCRNDYRMAAAKLGCSPEKIFDLKAAFYSQLTE